MKEENAAREPTVHNEDWRMTLEKAQQNNKKDLREYMGSLNAAQPGDQLTGKRRILAKARPLVHLWGMTKKEGRAQGLLHRSQASTGYTRMDSKQPKYYKLGFNNSTRVIPRCLSRSPV
jgi:hypothetical protein